MRKKSFVSARIAFALRRGSRRLTWRVKVLGIFFIVFCVPVPFMNGHLSTFLGKYAFFWKKIWRSGEKFVYLQRRKDRSEPDIGFLSLGRFGPIFLLYIDNRQFQLYPYRLLFLLSILRNQDSDPAYRYCSVKLLFLAFFECLLDQLRLTYPFPLQVDSLFQTEVNQHD